MKRTRQKLKANAPQTSGKIDKTFFLLTVILTVLGLFSVANTSAPLATSIFHDPFFFIKQQLLWALIGFVLLVIAASVPLSLLRTNAKLIFYVFIGLLVLVLIPGLGSKALGARRWLTFGPVGFQPSELIKGALALFFAYLADIKAPIKHYVWALVAVSGLIMLQPDLGTTITVVTIGFTQLFVIGFPLIQIGTIVGAGGAAALILTLTSDYRRARLMTFFGHTDPSGIDYHVRQILIALGSGGLFGLGLGQSRQKQLFLPETATDSVFAIIAEELGFIGATVILLLLVLFALRALKIVRNAPDTFTQILGIGLTAWIIAQVFFNVASMVALTPLTGIPLPFFSYGGSSLTMLLASVGILLNISKYAKDK